MEELKKKLDDIVLYMNSRFNQDSSEYSIFNGSKPTVFSYDSETAIATWSCGAIVCIKDLLYFLIEDDGFWRYEIAMKERLIATQGTFSIGWIDSFIHALNELKEYVEANGHAVYYVGTDRISHYSLGD